MAERIACAVAMRQPAAASIRMACFMIVRLSLDSLHIVTGE